MLTRADLLVGTSDYKGLSNTFIQAWMRRVPVASLKADPDSLLATHGLGILSRTEEQLARDVRRLLAESSERACIGARCRSYAIERHRESNIDKLARLLRVPTAPGTAPQYGRLLGWDKPDEHAHQHQ